MKIEYAGTAWHQAEDSSEARAASEILDGVWRESTTQYVGIREARLQQGLREPKGFQQILNKNIEARFESAGWDGNGGRYRFRDFWLRITFRHQMSIGSDFLDALRMDRKEGVKLSAICACPLDVLRIISPNDATVMTSFEKLKLQAAVLNGVIDVPLMLGALVPNSEISSAVLDKLLLPRSRN